MNRRSDLKRQTKETDIEISINLDGVGNSDITTGIPFFDHMLTLFAFHGGFDLTVKAEGDIEVDCHHTMEDIGIVLGQCFKQALNDKVGIKRYSSIYLPMDESLSRIVLDISDRPYLVYHVNLNREKLGTMDTQNVKEFFKAFVSEARVTLHIELLYGDNDHHIVESIFKGFGRVLKDGSRIISNQINSTKGVL